MGGLDSKAKRYLDLLSKNREITPQFIDPKKARENFAQAPPEVKNIMVEVKEMQLSVIKDKWILVEKNEKIKIRIYIPEGDGPFPIIVYFHGGGWVIGDLTWSDASCKMIANKARCTVVSVEYRLAPEHKYPTPVQDAYKAMLWAFENHKSLNGNPDKLFVSGDSAGGNLANAVSMISKEYDSPRIVAQILIYPVTSMEFDTNSYVEFQLGYGLDKEKMIWYSEQYINNEKDKKNPYIAPLLSNNLNGLPPTLLLVAENDVLRDEGLAYAKRLQNSGIEVKTILEKGMIHGYFTNMSIFQDRIKESINKISLYINKKIKQEG